MLIEVSVPLTVRIPSGEVHLVPGQPVEFSEEEGLKLLAKAGSKVRLVAPSEPVTIDPAHPNARPVYWERNSGEIVGPAKPEFLAKVGASFWIVTTFEGGMVWVNADQLRSRKAFEQHVAVTGAACFSCRGIR